MNVPKLRFKEFNDEWEKSSINKLAEVNPKNSKIPDKFIYIDLESVSKGILLKENIVYRENAPSRAQREVKKDDILFQTVRPYQMNNYYVNKLQDLPYIASTGYAILRVFDINSLFLYNILHTKKFVAIVLDNCTGTSYPAINSNDLSLIKISYPKDKKEQEKIGTFLSLLDKKIELQSKKIEALKLYKLYYIDVCINDKKEKKIILSKIGCFYRGLSYNSNNVVNNGLLVLRSNNIDNGLINYKNIQFVNKVCSKEILLQDKDIVICMANGSKDLVGKSGEYIKNSKYKLITVGAFCSIFRSDENYVKYIFQSSSYHKKLDKMFEGTNINNLKNSNLEKLTFGIDRNIDKYVLILNKLDFKIKLEKEKLSKLESLKKGFMQNMFV